MPATAAVARAGASRRGRLVRPGGVQVTEMQRARMLSSAVRVVSEVGYQRMSVARVAGGARVSRRTFYDVFADREDCFLAAFEESAAHARRVVLGAYESAVEGVAWRERVRAGLAALLEFFEREPGIASLLVVDALSAGPRVLRARAGALRGVSAALEETAPAPRGGKGVVSPLVGEGVVGAVFSVIHTRLTTGGGGDGRGEESLTGLLNPLMATVVLPYLGQAAAQREFERRAPARTNGAGETAGVAARARSSRARTATSEPETDPLVALPMRLTYRTMCVLGAIAQAPDSSNRAIGQAAGAYDQGQISKLLARLEKLGLVRNTTGQRHQPTGEPNAWVLTALGERVCRATEVPFPAADGRDGEEKLSTEGSAPSDPKEKR